MPADENTTEVAKPPDFRHIGTWVFDLDNTLYPESSGVFAQIDARMTAYVRAHFGLPEAAARSLQKSYYRNHGTTLNGLMNVNGVDPEDYLSFVHEIDLSALAPNLHLASALARLPGRRFVFTNGCAKHSARVLNRLGLSSLFEDIWDIRTIGFKPKPAQHAYRTVLAKSGSDGNRTAMFDDIARNLVEAQALGMTTVWLKNGSDWSRQGPEQPVAQARHIDYETENLAAFLHSIRV